MHHHHSSLLPVYKALLHKEGRHREECQNGELCCPAANVYGNFWRKNAYSSPYWHLHQRLVPSVQQPASQPGDQHSRPYHGGWHVTPSGEIFCKLA